MSGNQNFREDHLNPRGDFYLRAVTPSGTVLWEYHDRNLIVSIGRNWLVSLLGGDLTGSLREIAVGSNGSDPLITDTAITAPFTKDFTGVTYPALGVLQIDWRLETSEANGMEIREFGLLNDNGELFARKNRATIFKDNTFALEGIWKIIF